MYKILHFGVDYLKFVFYEKEKHLFNHYFEGKSDNSNIGYHSFCEKRFQFIWSKSKHGNQNMIMYKSLPVIRIEKIENWGMNNKISYQLDFYGAFFLFEELQELLPIYKKLYSPYCKFSRLDICVDLACSPKEFQDAGHVTNFQIEDYIKRNPKTGDFQTWYLGNMNVSQNPRHFIRVYDKTIDVNKKEKMMFYLDYIGHNSVTRCEVQINNKSIQTYGVNWDHVLDDNKMIKLFRALVYKDIKGTRFNALYPLFAFDFEDLLIPKRFYEHDPVFDDKILESKYFRTWSSYSQTLLDNGVDIFSLAAQHLAVPIFPSLQKGSRGIPERNVNDITTSYRQKIALAIFCPTALPLLHVGDEV